jgi:predicted aminopeptidase
MTYALRMAKGQLTIVTEARKFSEVYADPEVSDSIKAKLHLIDEIKQFAYDSIGLKRSDNYTTFYDQKGQRLMYVVTAAEPFELKAHKWMFPILGEVPYKGFFDANNAKQEYYQMRKEGLDANIGGASGWSTLGWFKDPVLSSMLNQNEGDLAELIIHELTHGTLFVKDSVEYNENLAQFVGVEGAKWFLRSKHGVNSDELRSYETSLEEEHIKSRFMLTESRMLDSAYKSFTPGMSAQQKANLKQKYFLLIWRDASRLQLRSDSTFADRVLSKISRSGNTVFLQYIRYEGQQDNFNDLFLSSGSNLAHFVSTMKIRYGAVE